MESKHKIALIGDFLLRWKQQQRCWLEDQGHIIGFADFVLCSSYNIYMNIKHIRTLGIFQSNQVMETSLNVKVEKEFGAAFYWVTGASLNNFPTWDTLPLQRTFSSKSRIMKIPRQNYCIYVLTWLPDMRFVVGEVLVISVGRRMNSTRPGP